MSTRKPKYPTRSGKKATRNIADELLQSARDLKAGRWGRKTTFETQPNGMVRRRIVLPDGKVVDDEMLTGERWARIMLKYLRQDKRT